MAEVSPSPVEPDWYIIDDVSPPHTADDADEWVGVPVTLHQASGEITQVGTIVRVLRGGLMAGLLIAPDRGYSRADAVRDGYDTVDADRIP